jgi:hypothetical protein
MAYTINGIIYQNRTEAIIGTMSDLEEDLFLWGKAQGYKVSLEFEYYIIRDEEFCMSYSRKSKSFTCWYQGFGYDDKSLCASAFSDFQDLLDWIQECRDMEIVIGHTYEEMSIFEKTQMSRAK